MWEFLGAGTQDMTSVKLESIVCNEPEQLELKFSDNGGNKNVVYQLLDQIHNHDKISERRGLSERY